jgi:predicted MFS family arabinose efflux permease
MSTLVLSLAGKAAGTALGGPVGGVLGGLVALRWRPSRPLLVSHLVIVALAPYVAAFAVPLPTAALAALSLVAILTVIVGNTLWETVMQTAIPNETLSRVSSYDWAVSLVFMPLGFAIWGPLAEWIGVDTTLVLAAATIVAAKLAVLLVPEVRDLRTPAATGGEA